MQIKNFSGLYMTSYNAAANPIIGMTAARSSDLLLVLHVDNRVCDVQMQI